MPPRDIEEEQFSESEEDADFVDEEYVDEQEEFGRLREVSWEAPEHHHNEKGSDWYWALGIVVSVAAVTMIIMGNMLFGIVILLAGLMVALISSRSPRMVPFSVSLRGIRTGADFYPYSTLKCFYLNEEHPHHIQLLVQSKQILSPLLIIPVPDDAMEDIEYLLEARLPEAHLDEPLGHRVLEFLGF